MLSLTHSGSLWRVYVYILKLFSVCERIPLPPKSNFFVFLLFKIPIVEWSRRASVFYSSPNTQEGRECGFPKWWCHLCGVIFVVLHFTVLPGLCSASHLREWCRASHLPTATLPITRRSTLAIGLVWIHHHYNCGNHHSYCYCTTHHIFTFSK